MKNTITLFFILLSPFFFSQSSLTVFNNSGQQFYVILNGIKQNSIAQTNVPVSGIKNGSYSVKLIFADGKTPDIDKNFMLDEPSDVTTRVVFKKGKGKLQLIGMEPANSQSTLQNTVVYRPNDAVTYSDAVIVSQTINQQVETVPTQINSNTGLNQNGQVISSGSTQESQTIQQSTTVTDPVNGNVGININMNVQDPALNNGQGGVNMSVNMNGTQSQTTTFTTTTSSSSSIGQSGTTTKPNSQAVSSSPKPIITCQNILGDAQATIDDLETMNFEDDQIKVVKADLANYCLTAAQAYKIIEVFNFEENRLELAKYFYDRMIDKDKGNTLLNLFNFDATKVEFRNYIRK